MKKLLLLPLLLVTLQVSSQIYRDNAQGAALSGVLKEDHDITKPVPWAKIVLIGTDVVTYSDGRGFFVVNGVRGVGGAATLEISADGYETLNYPVSIGGGEELGLIFLKPLRRVLMPITVNDLMPTRPEVRGDMIGEIGTAALFWSDDPLSKAANLNLGMLGYKMRGYNWMNTEFQINGVSMNEPETGYAFAGLFAGLNDFTHNGTGTQRILSEQLAYGDIGGSSGIRINPLEYRQQFKASYSFSNSLFTNQLSVSYATGELPSGWALNVMASGRNGAGFVDGTDYKGFSYLFAAAKDFDGSNNFTFFVAGAPTERGMVGYSPREAYDFVGTKSYNPAWGFHQGKKRNAQKHQYHQPLIGLQHYWEIEEDALLRTSLSYSFGDNNETALNWSGNALDPRPDTYDKIPTPFEDPAYRQVNWDRLYAVNDTASNGTYYIGEGRHANRSLVSFNSVFDMEEWGSFAPTAGVEIKLYNGSFYKEMEDLLGGRHWIDIDKFSPGVVLPSPDYYQNNLLNPNAQIGVGDRFGYSYTIEQQSYKLWTTWRYIWGRYKASVGGSIAHVAFKHVSNMENGKTTEGGSASHGFFNYSYKAGIAYKIDGNSDIELNTLQSKRAPLFANAYLAPRINGATIDGLKNETVMGGEINYTFSNSRVVARANGFFTRFTDQSIVRSYYDSDYSSFVNMALSGVDQRHIGGEVSGTFKITPNLKAHASASYGIYKYTSNPTGVLFQENLAKRIVNTDTLEMKGLYVAATPQMVFSGGAQYDFQRWWLGLTMNYAGNNYVDMNPLVRKIVTINGRNEEGEVEPEPEPAPDEFPKQEKLSSIFTFDFHGGYTFEFGDRQKKAISLNLNVQNLLGSKGYLGAYQPFGVMNEGVDPNKFNPRYAPAYGRTMFLMVSFIF